MDNNVEPYIREHKAQKENKIKGLPLLILSAIALLLMSTGYSQHIDAADMIVARDRVFKPCVTYVESVLSNVVDINYAGTVNLQGRNSAYGRIVTTGPSDVVDTVFRRTVDLENRTEQVPDANLDKGKTKVIKNGYKGKAIQTVIRRTEGSELVSEEIVSEFIIVEPQNKVMAVGTRNPVKTVNTSRGAVRYTKMMVMKATAYEPSEVSCGIYANGYTAIGMVATKGVVAVDPRVIPMRTKLYIEGYGFAVAADVGSAIKGNRIDLCYDTVQECLNFGRRNVKVYILE